MRSPATTSWTWRPRPMFASALTSRSTPLWRSACSTRSRPPCRSPEPRSRRRNGRHRSLPVLQRLRCRSPAPAPSTDRLISRPDPAVLGLRVAVGDPALDEPAGETEVPAFRQFALLGWLDDGVDDWSTSGMCRLLPDAWDSQLAGAPRNGSCSNQGRSVACAERLTVWQASAEVAGRRIRPSPSPVRRNRRTARHSRRLRRELRNPTLAAPSTAELRHLVRLRTLRR